MISFTVMSIVAVVLPPVFVAVIVYVVKEEIIVGVPLIIPVDESIVMPVGSVGEIVHETTAPPLIVGDAADIAVSLVSTKAFGL